MPSLSEISSNQQQQQSYAEASNFLWGKIFLFVVKFGATRGVESEMFGAIRRA
jgi:hypothetical protein